MNTENVTLKTIGQGAAIEMFQAELEKVIQNIMDPNTVPDKARTITLKVKIKPGKGDRSFCTAEVSCTSTMAGSVGVESQIVVGEENGKAVAGEIVQGELFGETVDQKTGEIIVMTGGQR